MFRKSTCQYCTLHALEILLGIYTSLALLSHFEGRLQQNQEDISIYIHTYIHKLY